MAPEVMRETAISFSEGHINVPQAAVIVKKRIESLSPSIEAEKIEIDNLKRSIEIMNDEKPSAGGSFLAVRGNSEKYGKVFTE